MKRNKKILKAKKILPMSKSTKGRISHIAKNLKGKELFPKKVDLAKRTLANIKSLPI